MLRGAVFIGVDRTGGQMPELRAAASGARQLYDWAVDPDLGGLDPASARLVTDADGGSVTIGAVKDAVKQVQAQGVDQLVIYFAGHGLLVNLVETWMLSDAPDDGGAAVSVGATIAAAERGATPQVVIISDACRLPAQHIPVQSLTPSSALPNPPAGGPRQRVDVFYACAPGQAALELNTIDAQGIFTSVLHDALIGTLHDAGGKEHCYERGVDDDPLWYLWPGPLGEYLEVAVGNRLIDLGIDRDQAPSFDIQYGNHNRKWLSRIRFTDDSPAGRSAEIAADSPLEGLEGLGGRSAGTPRRGARGFTDVVDDLITVIVERPESFDAELDLVAHHGMTRFADSAHALLTPGRPGSAITVDGASIDGAWLGTLPLRTEQAVVNGSRVGGSEIDGPPAAVTVAFTDARVAVLPVLPERTTRVHLSGTQIVSVVVDDREPTAETLRAQQLRQLRAVIVAAAQRGRHASVTAGFDVVRSLSRTHPIDPTLLLLAAYSAHAQRDADEVSRLVVELSEAIGGYHFPDARLLAPDAVPAGTVPLLPFPALSMGWELLPHPNSGVDDALADALRPHLLPSLWTVFGARALPILHPPH